MMERMTNANEFSKTRVGDNLHNSERLKKLDLPLNKEFNEVSSKNSRRIENMKELDKPLNSEKEVIIKNEMSKEISSLAKEMLSVRGIDNMRKQYANLDKELNGIQKEFENAKSPAERMAALNKIEQTKGRAMEDVIKETLKGKFDSIGEKQISVETKEGRTKPDLILNSAKESFTIGDTHVKKGEKLGAEIKCGSAEYMTRETKHISDQVLGHPDNSVVILTNEYNDMSTSAKNNLIRNLKERNSSVCALEISSSQVKKALLENIMNRVNS